MSQTTDMSEKTAVTLARQLVCSSYWLLAEVLGIHSWLSARRSVQDCQVLGNARAIMRTSWRWFTASSRDVSSSPTASASSSPSSLQATHQTGYMTRPCHIILRWCNAGGPSLNPTEKTGHSGVSCIMACPRCRSPLPDINDL